MPPISPAASTPGEASVPPPHAVPPGSLKHRAVRSTAWTIVGFAFSQAMRFGSNVTLAYFLGANGEEAFGLMMFVSLWITGLAMFSDVGIGPSIIQNPRGTEREYLNTAWTIQVIRGVFLWGLAALLAYPVSLWWGEPSLRYLLPVVGVTAAIAGFNATSLFTLNRDLTISKVVALNLGTQAVTVAVMLAWAWFSPTVWALVAGGIAGALTRMLASHLLVRPTNRFQWDAGAARELFRFGRWITVSTAFTFLASRVDQFMLPAVLGFDLMGVFSVAFSMSQILPMLMSQFVGAVGFPALADLYRRDEVRFRWRLRQMRILVILPISGGLLAMAVVGPWVIRMLYPEQYHEAGWMLTALAIGTTAAPLCVTYGNAHLAMGNSFRLMLTVVAHFLLVIPVVLIGYQLAGATGFIYGMASMAWIIYGLHAALAIRARIWQPEVDLPVLLVCGLVGGYLLLN